MNSSWWHPAQKLWSVVNTEKNLKQLKIIFGKDYIIEKGFVPRPVKKRELNKEAAGAVFELEKVLTLKGKTKKDLSDKNFDLHWLDQVRTR